MLVRIVLFNGAVVELADTTDLKFVAFGREGSIPSGPIERRSMDTIVYISAIVSLVGWMVLIFGSLIGEFMYVKRGGTR